MRHVRILGRPVDFARLIAQRMNKLVRASLEFALSRFESRALDGVVDLRLIRVTRLTHGYLEALPHMDAFDMCLREAADQAAFLTRRAS